MNGLVFSVEDIDGDVSVAETAADSTMGLEGIGGGVEGDSTIGREETIFGPPIFRFRCISKSPTFSFSSATSVSSQTSNISASNPLGKVTLRIFFFSNEPCVLISDKTSVLAVASDVFTDDTIFPLRFTGEEVRCPPIVKSWICGLCEAVHIQQ